MARFGNGWVKLSRSVYLRDQQNNYFYGRGIELAVFMNLIAWANIQDGKARQGKSEIIISRGTLITSVAELTNQSGLSRQNIRTALKNLQENGKINQVSNHQGLIITVCNYDEYQFAENTPNQQPNQRVTSGQPTANQRLTNASPLIEELKNSKTEKEEKENLICDAPHKPNATLVNLADFDRKDFPDNASYLAAIKKAASNKISASKTAEVWEAYRMAYFLMHGIEPISNSATRSQASRFIDLVGVEDAPEVAEWYVMRETGFRGWLITSRHPFGELVKSWQTYWGNWKAGSKISPTAAENYDRDSNNLEAAESYLAKKHAANKNGRASNESGGGFH